MVRSTTEADDESTTLPTKSEAFDIIDEARAEVGDDFTADIIEAQDGDLRRAAAVLAEAVVESEDARFADVDTDEPFADRDDLEVVDRHPDAVEKARERYDHDHDFAKVVRLSDSGTPKKRSGYTKDGRFARVDNTTYKCVDCGVETGTTPWSTVACDGD
jgi:hypothetical protein